MAEPMRREIDPRIAAGTGSMTGEKADDDERKDDGGSRTKQIERKRERQVVSLAKAMRAGRDSRYAEPDKSDAKCEKPLATADRPQQWPTAGPHVHDRRRLLLVRGGGLEIVPSRRP